MALLSLDRHDVLETIRQSNDLHEAFLRVAKLPAVGEYKTLTNADRIRAMTDEELADFVSLCCGWTCAECPVGKECNGDECFSTWLDWLKEEVGE